MSTETFPATDPRFGYTAKRWRKICAEAAEVNAATGSPDLNRQLEQARKESRDAALNSVAQVRAEQRVAAAMTTLIGLHGGHEELMRAHFSSPKAARAILEDARDLLAHVEKLAEAKERKVVQFYLENDLGAPPANSPAEELRTFAREHVAPLVAAYEEMVSHPGVKITNCPDPSWVLCGCSLGAIETS